MCREKDKKGVNMMRVTKNAGICRNAWGKKVRINETFCSLIML